MCSDEIAAIKAISEALAKEDRRVDTEEVGQAAKEAYKSAKRNKPK